MANEGAYIAGGASGAMSGAATGFAVGGGPVVAVVGGAVGLGLGLFGASEAEKAEKERKKLERKQRRERKNADAQVRRTQRRETAVEKERSSRAAKEQTDLPGVRLSQEDLGLSGNMAMGGGTPYDNYLAVTYGRKTFL